MSTEQNEGTFMPMAICPFSLCSGHNFQCYFEQYEQFTNKHL